MMRIIKSVYRTFVPSSVRNSPKIGKLRAHLLGKGHDWTYNLDYYERTVEGPAVRSAATIANSIVNEFKARRIIDVGCGTGALLETLRDKGCDVFGLEYSEAALKYCRSRGLSVSKFDLERDVFTETDSFDVAISMEVAEHLPEKVADRYVDLLTRLSEVIIFTAAPPGQGGTDHVNEQPASYWISKFRDRHFTHAEELSQRWRESWQAAGDVESWYRDNLMIFGRTSSSGS